MGLLVSRTLRDIDEVLVVSGVVNGAFRNFQVMLSVLLVVRAASLLLAVSSRQAANGNGLGSVLWNWRGGSLNDKIGT